MDKNLRFGLASLWSLGEKIHGAEGDGRSIAEAIAWILPDAQLCAVYSRPIGCLEMYAVKVGGLVSGKAGVWPERDYAAAVRKLGLVNAPCLIRPYLAPRTLPSGMLTEAMTNAPEFQELAVA